jgi:glycosyltransferase involved in cell wall biosynthesis
LKILQVHNFYRIRGGEDVVVERERELLRSAGFVVETFYKYSDKISGAYEKIRAGFELSSSSSIEQEFQQVLSQSRPDIVHVHNFFPLITPLIFALCRREKIPVVFTLHNFRLFCANGLMLRSGKPCDLCLTKGVFPAVLHSCYRNSRLFTLPVARMIAKAKNENIWQEQVDLFVSTTEFTKSVYEKYGIPKEKVLVKGNFSPDLSTLQRKQKNFALYAGRLSEEKGIRTLVKSWKPKFGELRFCGTGPLAEWIRESGFSVVQNANQNELHQVMAECKYLILPTECYETGIPLIAMEAASLGIPMIISKFGAAQEAFDHGKNALLFAPGDVAELQAGLRKMNNEENLRKDLGNGARQLYLARFTEKDQSDQLMKIYLRAKNTKK